MSERHSTTPPQLTCLLTPLKLLHLTTPSHAFFQHLNYPTPPNITTTQHHHATLQPPPPQTATTTTSSNHRHKQPPPPQTATWTDGREEREVVEEFLVEVEADLRLQALWKTGEHLACCKRCCFKLIKLSFILNQSISTIPLMNNGISFYLFNQLLNY